MFRQRATDTRDRVPYCGMVQKHGDSSGVAEAASTTFSDAIAMARRSLWTQTLFCTSPLGEDLIQIPRALVAHLSEMLCYAA